LGNGDRLGDSVDAKETSMQKVNLDIYLSS
jgi:hypothetical protein